MRKPDRKDLFAYIPSSDVPSDVCVYPYITAEHDENRLLGEEFLAFLMQCALARYVTVNCQSNEIHEIFEQWFGAQEGSRPSFFTLNEKGKICEYDVRTGKYVELNPGKEERHLKQLGSSDKEGSHELDPKDSDEDSTHNSDTSSNESSSSSSTSAQDKCLLSRSPSPVLPANNSSSNQLPRKNSGPSLFQHTSPRIVESISGVEPPMTLTEKEKDSIYQALRFRLHDVEDVDSRFLNHVKEAPSREVLLLQIENFIPIHAKRDSKTRESFKSEQEALMGVRDLLQSPKPDFSLLEDDAQKGRAMPSFMSEKQPVQIPVALEQTSFKVLLIQAITSFLNLILDFLSRMQCAPISPFCAHRLTC